MKIPRYKPKFTQHIIILFAVIITMLNLSANKLTTHAEEGDINRFAKALVEADSKGTGGGGGTTATTNGVSYTRTGYLCYMLTTDGQTVPGTNAKAFKSPGYNGIANSQWNCKSRKGGYTASNWSGTAPWNCTPWESGGSPTNEPKIRAWMTEKVGDTSRGAIFVQDQWGPEVAESFGRDELVLVVETIMNFQWSTTGGSGTSSTSTLTPRQRATRLVGRYSLDQIMSMARGYGFGGTCDTYDRFMKKAAEGDENAEYNAARTAGKIVERLIDKITSIFEEGGTTTEESTGGECITHGSPVIGTLPCLLDYKSKLSGLGAESKTRLNSYTNKVACFAEMIEAGKAGEAAGFKPWTGSTGSEISDANVKYYGLAMGVYTAHGTTPTTGTHTWDSDKNPSGSGAEDKAPEPPTSSTPLERKFTIIKSYRVKDKTTGVIEDRGTFKRTQTVATIRIKDEPLNTTDKNYKVIGWKHSSTDQPTSLTSLN